jgi:hypothetical protein
VSAGGHFAGMPTRSLHAHGAVVPDDTSGCPPRCPCGAMTAARARKRGHRCAL